MDRSYVTVFSQYAKSVLNSLPANATLMVNDDMNCNTLHYMMRCEHYREDVNLLKIPLITYEWWKPMQSHHFPNIRNSFPGSRHHPFDPHGFDMKTFLDVNVVKGKPPVYVLGDWKSGDDSQDIFERVPVGLADRVERPGTAVNLVEFAEELDKNLVREGAFDSRGTIAEVEGSWELVMRVKVSSLGVQRTRNCAPLLLRATCHSSSRHSFDVYTPPPPLPLLVSELLSKSKPLYCI